MSEMLTLGRAVIAETYRPDSARRFAVDLNRPGAYWRPLNRVEQKIDFAAVEIADGDALQRSRMRLGLILAAQMTKLISQTRAPSYGPAHASRMELPLTKEVSNEFFRLAARAYWDGAQVFDRSIARSAQLSGKRVPPPRVYGLSAMGVKRLEGKARKRGVEFCDSLRKQLQPVFDATFSPAGLRMKPQAMLEAEIRTVYAGWIDAAPTDLPATVELAAVRPLDAKDEGEYESWERRTVPVTDWIQVTANRITKAKQPAPALKTSPAAMWLETERTRQLNAGITAAALKDQSCVAYQYSAIRDGKTCPTCKQYDPPGGKPVIRPKNDDFWVFNTPPLHWRCRCHLIPIFAWENVRYSTDAMLDEIDTSALGPGFGSYDRSANEMLVPTMRVIERSLKKPKKAGAKKATISIADRMAAAQTAVNRALAEYQRALGELEILKLTQSADDIAYFREHGVYRPGSDLAHAAARMEEAWTAYQRAQGQYRDATRAAG